MTEALWLFRRSIAAAALAGVGCPLVGVFVVTMRVPFIGVAISHAAMAGAVAAHLFGAGEWAFAAALAAGLAAAAAAGPMADRTRLDPNLSLAVLFAGTMGLAFLGIGLAPEPRTPMLGLLWGSLNFVGTKELAVIAVSTALAGTFVLLFFKELRAVVFSREVAFTAGVPAAAVYYSVLFLSGGVVASNLETIGGLMLYGLMFLPAAGAQMLARTLAGRLKWACSTGVVCSLGGFALSYFFSLPSGATIVLLCCAAFGASAAARRA